MRQHTFEPGDFVQTSLGKGFVKYRNGAEYLIQLGDCRFRFQEQEIKMLQTREDRAKNGPRRYHKLKRAQEA